MELDSEFEGRYSHIEKLLLRSGPFAYPGFEPSEDTKKFLLEKSRILIIGAGGLGCELLKDVALSGFRDIVVIDLDTIDLSNLNRQFLFRKKDVGKPKAVVAAEFIMKRVPGVKVTPIHGNIKDQDLSFYKGFNLIICGLDSIDARRWINATVYSLVEYDDDGNVDPSTIVPVVDGGTEGFKGQARTIFPSITSCFECTLPLFPPKNTFPLCTIANTPRLPEHCIEWAATLQWPEAFPKDKLDGDNPEHVTWVFEKAQGRAKEHNIPGVTYRLTQGVIKNIIPAIASTNAVIAAACANEAFKIATSCSLYLNNYMMYMGGGGVYTFTFEYEKNPECLVCGSAVFKVPVSSTTTLEQFMEDLATDPRIQLKAPSLTHGGKPLYLRSPPQLEEGLRPNLQKLVTDLVPDGGQIVVTDRGQPFAVNIIVIYKK
jgi:ubiquitin-activating enzyme E1 C